MFILMVNGNIELPFKEAKKYEVGTGYVALHENDEAFFLCRYLCDCEKGIFANTNYLYEYPDKTLNDICSSKGIESGKGKAVLIITSHAESFIQTDKMIEGYERALRKLPEVLRS